jgi:hypothetical protein
MHLVCSIIEGRRGGFGEVGSEMVQKVSNGAWVGGWRGSLESRPSLSMSCRDLPKSLVTICLLFDTHQASVEFLGPADFRESKENSLQHDSTLLAISRKK